MPGRVRNVERENIAAALKLNVSTIFDQVQVSTANHHKNLTALSKLQAEAAQYTEPTRDGNFKLVGERLFEDAFQIALTHALPFKKGAATADRVVKFIGGYVKFLNERAIEEKKAQGILDDDDEGTTASRFTAKLLRFLLRGFNAKDKSVRYRILQVVAETVSHLGEIDEDTYIDLRTRLLERANDREISVRVQAFIGLSKLCGSEEPAEVEESEATAADILIDSLAHDPSADVRRAILLNLPINDVTLPYIIDRTRDTDNTIRKLVYSAVLGLSVFQGKSLGPTHPRSLSIAQRELIVRNGLGDREAAVRTAAGILIGAWLDAVGPSPVKAEDDTKAEGDVEGEPGILAFLKLFYLGENSTATDALLSVFATRADIFENIEFGDQYWAHLTPETAFLARVFVEYCKTTKDETRLEAVLPVVTRLAFEIQQAYNSLIKDIEAGNDGLLATSQEEEHIQREEQRQDKEFVLGEMLKLAVHLDYADEIGRRKMFQLVRDMISQEALPESLLAGCLDVLCILSTSERDLIRVIVGIVQDFRDPGDDENDEQGEAEREINTGDTPVRPTKERQKLHASPSSSRANEIELKCLSLCIRMLERVNGILEDNLTLHGILDELIFPALQRTDNDDFRQNPLRQKALTCLGLCSLIDKRLARLRLKFFWNEFKGNPSEAIKLNVLRIVFDLLMAHEGTLREEDGVSWIIGGLIKRLGAKTSHGIRALLSIGISKLVLSGVIQDPVAIKNLIIVYLSPATADNQELLQCLVFFLPAYSYSSQSNQQQMRQIFIDLFVDLKQRRAELQEGEEMTNHAQIGAMFIDWTDPLKLSKAANAGNAITDEAHIGDGSIHIDLAIDIFMALLKRDDLEKEDKKVLCQLLGKLYIPDAIDDDKIRTLKLYMHNVHSRRPLRDTVTNNAFTKFDTLISKKFEKQLEDFSEEEYRKLEELKDSFEFLDLIPKEEDTSDAPRIRGRKRLSESVARSSSEGSGSSPPRRSGKNQSKRQRLSTSDDSDSDIIEIDPPPRRGSTVPTRTMPKRSAATKQPKIIEISSDSDEGATPNSKSKPSRPNIKREQVRDDLSSAHDDGDNISSEIPFDSNMDPDPDSEEEVNDLLAEE